MRLTDFPRPKGDNGRGLHWSPSPRPPTESALDFWMDELHAMHIKWLKIVDDGQGSTLPLVRRLVAEDIMPIVRLQRQGPPPHRLTPQERETVRRLVDAGVVYFEVDSEPDLPSAWSGNMPPNAFDLIIDAFIEDADDILNAGGLPGIPPMALTPAHNPVQAIVDRDREDLFQRGTWWAVHAYTYNRPLNYPDDDVNRTGRPVTPEEYKQHHPWGWNEPPEIINRWRAEGRQPDTTLADDPQCFRAYELAGHMAQEVLGYPIPIIATEGGAITGLRDDRRYPRLDPWTAAEWTVQINEFLQREAPLWFFTLCHWLIADRRIDPTRPHVWEPHCWYTHWWDEEFGFNGMLPVVERVKAMPSLERSSGLIVPEATPTVSAPREEETPMPKTALISGTVVDAENTPIAHVEVELLTEDGRALRAQTDEEGRFYIDNVPPGFYRIHVADRTDVVDLPVQPGDQIDLLFTLSEPQPRERITEIPITPEEERTTGVPETRETSPTSVTAEEPKEPEPLETAAETPPPVQPAATPETEEPRPQKVEIEAETPTEPPAAETTPAETANSRVIGHIAGGRPGIELLLKNDAGRVWETTLDENRHFEFTHLPAGTYTLELAGIGTIAKDIHLDGTNTVEVTFSLQGIVMGLVMGGTPEMLAELISDTYGWKRAVALSPQGQYRFVELPPGTYRVRIEGHELGPVTLQGDETVTMPTLDLRPPHRATLRGKITDAEGQALPEIPVHLMRRGELVAQTQTALNGTYLFQNMPAGEYQVIVVGPPDVVRTVRLEQDKTVILDIALPPQEEPEAPTVATEAPVEEIIVKTVVEPAAGIVAEPEETPTEPETTEHEVETQAPPEPTPEKEPTLKEEEAPSAAAEPAETPMPEQETPPGTEPPREEAETDTGAAEPETPVVTAETAAEETEISGEKPPTPAEAPEAVTAVETTAEETEIPGEKPPTPAEAPEAVTAVETAAEETEIPGEEPPVPAEAPEAVTAVETAAEETEISGEEPPVPAEAPEAVTAVETAAEAPTQAPTDLETAQIAAEEEIAVETPEITPSPAPEAVSHPTAAELPEEEVVAAPGKETRITYMDIYILVPPDGPRTRAILLAALPFLTAGRVTVGYNPEEARWARRVLIVGGPEAYGRDIEEMLKAAGCEVDRATGTLGELVEQFEAAAQAITLEKEVPNGPVG